MKRVLALILSVSLTGCVTHYQGPTPDFSLKGEAAQKEIEKFQFHFSWWTPAPGFFFMGPKDAADIYTGDSVKPVMRAVSPESLELEKKAMTWEYVRLGVLGAGLVYIFADRGDWEESDWAAFGGILAVSAGIGFYGGSLHKDAIDRYNRDLKEKFTPGLSYNFTY